MTDDTEIAWHREQMAKNHTILEELKRDEVRFVDILNLPSSWRILWA
jgi:hypothetical protein